MNFDLLVEEYEKNHAENIKASGFEPSYFDEYKIREVAGYLSSIGKQQSHLKFLNYGCGIGKSEKFIRTYLPNASIYSVDVSKKSVDFAKDKNKTLENVTFGVLSDNKIPFAEKFDVIFVANVFHHIPREAHLSTLRHLSEKLSDQGHLFFFEHNPLNPITVKTIKECPFDQDAVLLNPVYAYKAMKEGGFNNRSIRFTLFFPQLFSWLIPLERYLRKCPLGAQFYLIARKS
jgi:SAM-dependent methyltransferase